MKRILPTIALAAVFILSACSSYGSATPSPQATETIATPTSAQAPAPSPTQAVSATQQPTVAVADVVSQATASGPLIAKGDVVVFAWNDLGMHCLNPTYDSAVVLPPYNTVWAQVVKRGNPPQVVTEGIVIEYRLLNNTYSYGKAGYGQFWDNAQKLFGVSVEKDKGLNLKEPNVSNGLTGSMRLFGDHFEVVGMPVVPVDDSGTWNPFQVAEITVKNINGEVIAQTQCTVPTSDELNCGKCHGQNAFADILQKHDKNHGTQLADSGPVLCASCHASPALGNTNPGEFHFLSEHIHGFHGNLPNPPACYDCHPGAKTQCNRSLAHTSDTGNCTACHGDLMQVSSSVDTEGRVPWVNEPKCVTCHQNVAEVDTGGDLYRNAKGHGGVYCASCHGSPHTMVPSRVESDNYQAIQYQQPQMDGTVATIGSCSACHRSSHGGGDGEGGELAEAHFSPGAERPSACNVCHTSASADTSKWPHAFEWKNR